MKEAGQNKKPKGRQDTKNLAKEDDELYSFEYPAGPSSHVDKGRHNVNLAG